MKLEGGRAQPSQTLRVRCQDYELTGFKLENASGALSGNWDVNAFPEEGNLPWGQMCMGELSGTWWGLDNE